MPGSPFLGVLPGTKPAGWRDCPAELVGFVVSGAAPSVQPANPTGVNFARYLDLGNGFVLFKFRFGFDANTVFGTGEHIWAVRLPVPLNRATGGADLVNGTAQAWAGAAANPQWCATLRPSAMDPMFHGGNNGMEDYYIQFFNQYLLGAGTAAFALAGSTVAVNHGVGSTPNAYDVDVNATNTPTTAPGVIYISATSSSQITFGIRNASASGTALTLGWKVRMEPNGAATLDVLANHLRPFLWAAGSELSGSIVYEAQI